MFSFWNIVVILLIILLVFGTKRLPEIARALGKAINEFKKAKDEVLDENSSAGKPAAPEEKIHALPMEKTEKKEDSSEQKQG